MICLRCGHCCKFYSVAIVKNPDLGITEENIVMHLGDGTPCPHLRGDKPGEYSCAIHDQPWYPETPCARHAQVGSPQAECRMGKYVLQKHKEINND